MTYDELNEDQRTELKQRILMERNEQKGEGTSYEELADADRLVPDEDTKAWADGMEFFNDDFVCSATAKIERIPQWAVCYLVNNDDSALSPEDRKMVDDYVKRLLEKDRLRLVCPIDGTENGFCPHPAFGLPCETVDFFAERLRDDG